MQMILVIIPEERLEDLYFCQCVIPVFALQVLSWRHNNWKLDETTAPRLRFTDKMDAELLNTPYLMS